MYNAPFPALQPPISSDGEFAKALSRLHDDDDPQFYARLLRYCRGSSSLSWGRAVHARIRRSKQLCRDRYLANLLVEMYGKCGAVEEARAAFDSIQQPNVFSWTLLLLAYAGNGQLREAKQTFDSMPRRDVAAWNALISVYVDAGRVDDARQIFEAMPQRDVVSCTSMVTGYAMDGEMQLAKRLFHEMPVWNVVAWNAILAGYAQQGSVVQAKRVFDSMPCWDVFSWNIVAGAYAHRGQMKEATEMLLTAPELDVVSWNTMITGYVQSGDVDQAKRVFDGMQERDVLSWNAMITGYAQKGLLQQAQEAFHSMPQTDVSSWNALITAYAQNARLEEAKLTFDTMPRKDAISWSSMVSGYVKNGHGSEAIALFDAMVELEECRAEWPATQFACVSAIEACAAAGSISDGRAVHLRAVNVGLGSSTVVVNALVNMYSKCGRFDSAKRIFEAMPWVDLISWNTMLSCASRAGEPETAMELLRAMAIEGAARPNGITFFGALSACCYAGIWSQALGIFTAMTIDYGIVPEAGHFACLTDLLAKLGRLNEAEEVLVAMPHDADCAAWTALASSSRLHGDATSGARAAATVGDAAARYVLLSGAMAPSPMLPAVGWAAAVGCTTRGKRHAV